MARRGSFMGLTLPAGGFTSDWSDLFARVGNLSYVRCGYPEIWSMLSSPSNSSNAGSFSTSVLESEVAAVHAAGYGYCWSMLGVPKQVNASATSGDNHYYPTTSGGRTQMGYYAALAAIKLMDAHRATGKPVFFEFGQESNINDFNRGNANAATVAAAHKAVIDAVRGVEPDLPIIFGSVANRGDINNSGDADVIAHWDGPHWVADLIAAEPTLKTTSAPDYWGYHPYVDSSDPQSLSVGWGMQQMLAFAYALAVGGAKSPGGGSPQVCVTEFGPFRTRTLSGISGTSNGSANLSSTSGFSLGPASSLGEEGADISGTNIPSGTTILTVNSDTNITMSQNATGTVSGVTVTRNDFAAEQVYRYLTAFDSYRTAGWVSGPEFAMGQFPTDPLAMWADSSTPYLPGLAYEILAAVELGPDTPAPPPTISAATSIEYKIEIGVPPFNQFATDTLVIDDSGARGQYDNGNKWADAWTFNEITDSVQEFTIRWGKNNELDRTDAGTLSLTVRNDRQDLGTAGDFSAFNWTSPYFPFLGPRTRIRVTVDGTRLFLGELTAIPTTHIQDNVVETHFEAADLLGYLAKTNVSWIPEATHSAGKRIARILDKAGVTERGDNSYLFTGVNTYIAGVRIEGSALDQCNDVAFSEGGYFYADQQTYIFIDREHMMAATPLMVWSDDPAEPLRYSSATEDVPFDGFFFNSCTINGLEEDQVPAVATSDTSRTIYGHIPVDYTLPIATNFGRQYRADQLITDFKVPRAKITSITIPTARYTKAQRNSYIYQYPGHCVQIDRAAPGVSPAISQVSIIIGMEHRASNGGRDFETTWYLTDQL